MPPSQLKRLKSSLREQGVLGPQKSKAQKKQATKSGSWKDSRIQKSAALQGIREQFNPFEFKGQSRSKHEYINGQDVNGEMVKGQVSRPGVAKGLGEENRRRTLLVEMQRRKKTGGITDRRFGENDPTMTPEDKALQRFVREKQREKKRGSLFDLENGDEDNTNLTHAGKSLSFTNVDKMDDFDERSLENSDQDEGSDFLEERPTKRRRLSTDTTSDGSLSDRVHHGPAAHPKTKKEVMEDIIAKSKLHKYERQQAKEDDDELRAELDKGLPDVFALLRDGPKPAPPPQNRPDPYAGMNPDRLALLNGKDRSQAEKEYDERLRQMAMDQRAKPAKPTLTEEEKLRREAERLQDLETKRLQRMRGEPNESDAETILDPREHNGAYETDRDEEYDAFGLGSGLQASNQRADLGVEDEDDFVIEDNLVGDASDLDVSEPRSEELEDESSPGEDDEFVQGLLSKEDAGRQGLDFSNEPARAAKGINLSGNIAYTYACPQSHEELLNVTKAILIQDLPVAIQRIRALYHPKLAAENKVRLGNFATALVHHIPYLGDQPEHPPFAILEAVIRHIHSLAKMFPEQIGGAFRSHLKTIHEQRPNSLSPGDLIIFTANASIFPTSDHFHQVVTPAMLCMSRYLGQKIPGSLSDLVMGTYIVTLCLQYQRLSKRYMPEVVNYILNTLWALAPVKPKQRLRVFPHHSLPDNIRLQGKLAKPNMVRPLAFWDILPPKSATANDHEVLKLSLLHANLDLIAEMTVLWAEHSAFCEVFDPIYTAIRHLESAPCLSKFPSSTQEKLQTTSSTLHTHLQHSFTARRPLRLHNHRPLAIKTSVPKFEESYNPDRRYDHDRDRAELSKLKAQHKKERKGALRELRKDANFMARENLREKRERDSAYERKYKRLVAEIQGEEGREGKAYEREKRARRGKR
ncbi:nucleolar complex protein 14 [Lecanora helva]